MAWRIVNAVREDMMDLLNAAVNAGSSNGLLKIYSGTVHATRGTAPSGTLLGTLTLADPAFTSANGVLTLGTVTEDSSADDDGAAGCFTLSDSDNNIVADGSITGIGGGGEIEMNTTTIVAGGPIGITSGTITLT